MKPSPLERCIVFALLIVATILPACPWHGSAAAAAEKPGAPAGKGPPPVPVRVAAVIQKTVSEQISIIGTTEAIAVSTVASEVSGRVEDFPVKAGDFVKTGQLLASLNDAEMQLRLKSLVADRERVRANLENAERELERIRKLRQTNSIAETKYDTALYAHRAISNSFLRSQAEIDHLSYQIGQKKVFAPFPGVVAEEHTQVGQWVNPGGAVVTLMDMAHVLVTVDVSERFALKISPVGPVRVLIRSVSEEPFSGDIYAILYRGDARARTLPVRVRVKNPDFRIRAGMEARVTFNLADTKQVLLVPKDAVVTAGAERRVYAVNAEQAFPVSVTLLGYYGGDVAVAGDLQPDMRVVIRGNERLRPGQAVRVEP